MKYVLTIIIVLAVLVGGALLYAWSGIYNIAATEHHWAVTKSFIELLKDRSIEAHSKGIRAMDVTDPKVKEASFFHYHNMCRHCHGAPGFPSDEFSSGLYPQPPAMTAGHLQKELGKTEIYWIVKHGLKMTGMPAFGPTHDEKQLWGLVSIVEDVPKMSAEDYMRQVKAGSPKSVMPENMMEDGHSHGS